MQGSNMVKPIVAWCEHFSILVLERVRCSVSIDTCALIYYTGQKKVALLDVETHDNPIPLESYTMTQGKVWAVICQPGKLFIIINLKECDN